MIGELEESKGEVFNVEYIQNGYMNLKNIEKMAPQLKSNPIFAMAIEQIKNGLGEEHTEYLE